MLSDINTCTVGFITILGLYSYEILVIFKSSRSYPFIKYAKGLGPGLVKIKRYKIGICCSSVKHEA